MSKVVACISAAILFFAAEASATDWPPLNDMGQVSVTGVCFKSSAFIRDTLGYRLKDATAHCDNQLFKMERRSLIDPYTGASSYVYMVRGAGSGNPTGWISRGHISNPSVIDNALDMGAAHGNGASRPATYPGTFTLKSLPQPMGFFGRDCIWRDASLYGIRGTSDERGKSYSYLLWSIPYNGTECPGTPEQVAVSGMVRAIIVDGDPFYHTDTFKRVRDYVDQAENVTARVEWEYVRVRDTAGGYIYGYVVSRSLVNGVWYDHITQSPPGETVIDNASSSFSASANWSTGTSAADKYGTDYRFRSTAAVSDEAAWTFNVPTTRNYELYAWWSGGTNRAAAAPYILPDGSSVSRNQQNNGGSWQSLGIRNLAAGQHTIKLSCSTTAGFVVIADGIKVVDR